MNIEWVLIEGGKVSQCGGMPAPRCGPGQAVFTLSEMLAVDEALHDQYLAAANAIQDARIIGEAKGKIDVESLVNIDKMHAYKRQDAQLYKIDPTINAALIPYLVKEHERCLAVDPNATLDACADVILAKANETVSAETQRVTDKSNI